MAVISTDPIPEIWFTVNNAPNITPRFMQAKAISNKGSNDKAIFVNDAPNRVPATIQTVICNNANGKNGNMYDTI